MIEPMRVVNQRLEQGGGHDHAERGGAESAEQPDRHEIVPQLGGEAGEKVAEAEARQAEAVGDARAEAVDQLAGEGSRKTRRPACRRNR